MTSVKDKLELIGIVAVIVSILILGYEIRQNTDTSAAQAVFELNESARQTLFQEATDPNLASLISKAEKDLEALSELERYMYGRWVFAHVNLPKRQLAHSLKRSSVFFLTSALLFTKSKNEIRRSLRSHFSHSRFMNSLI